MTPLLIVANPEEGINYVKDILYGALRDTVIFLSGGSQKTLHVLLAREKRLNVGAVGLVDERFGAPGHLYSNALMIEQTGLVKYLQASKISFYPILKAGLNRQETAALYDQTVRQLFFSYPKHIALLGMGPDGHIAGIAPNRPGLPAGEAGFQNPLFSETSKDVLVSSFADPKSMKDGGFGERITMTFTALEEMTSILVLAFGNNKKEAVKGVFQKGAVEELPARFLTLSHMVKKTLFITDQKV